MIFSDKHMKKDVAPTKPEMSLAAVRKMPVKSWKYKGGSAGDDGGKRHTGPMAQDARAAMGEKTAPGGKQIDLISMMGHTVNAVKALDKKVTLSLAHARRPAKA
ncbi:Chaperone of endosialidase [compost metagenome]